MVKYPKVNYIGNKEKIANWIIENLPIKNGKILDLFAGGCSTSYAFKKHNFCVYSNDILYSSFCLSKALIENNEEKLEFDILPKDLEIFNTATQQKLDFFYTEAQYKKISWLSNKLYFDNEVRELASLINYSKSLKDYEYYIFLSLLRRAMIRKLPYSRMCIKWEEIVKFRDEELSYKKYGRRRAYHNITFLEHIFDNLNNYNQAIFNNFQNNLSFNLDCFEILKRLDYADLIYIDPPYPNTMNNYFSFYGAFDEMLDIKHNNIIDFTKKDVFLNNLKKIFSIAISKTNYIALSVNNHSKPHYVDVIKIVKSYIKNFQIFEKSHLYKVTGKERKKQTSEILIVFDLNN
ncbi:DNA adenine methylase [Campylobacter sp.]|uniref:DNA adenine methylase n=1 Tax=Campylobacter sp. TaxID=205 RepID=UPI002AA88A80|nr:DNA adenine methylase [Campylobacter sp.]MCI7076746.1 DNA adenine methylase [Campylobacter sp.]